MDQKIRKWVTTQKVARSQKNVTRSQKWVANSKSGFLAGRKILKKVAKPENGSVNPKANQKLGN